MHLYRAVVAAAMSLAAMTTWANPALAQTAPPGNSAVDQYLETVPSAAGNVQPAPAPKPRKSVLPARVRDALVSEGGSDGVRLAGIVDSTGARSRNDRVPSTASPAATGGTSDYRRKRTKPTDNESRRKPSGAATSPTTSLPEGSTRAAIFDGLTASGMGWMLPAVLLFSAGAAFATGIVRHRRA